MTRFPPTGTPGSTAPRADVREGATVTGQIDAVPRGARVYVGVVAAAAAVILVWAVSQVLTSGWGAGPALTLALILGGASTVAAPALAVPRPSAYVVTAEELFLIPMLMLLDPAPAVLAGATSVALGRIAARTGSPIELLRRTALHPLRFTFSVSKALIGWSIAAGIHNALATPEIDARHLAVCTFAALVFHLTSVLMVGGVRQLTGSVRVTEHVREELGSGPLAVVFGAIAVGLILATASIAFPSLALVFVALVAVHQVWSTWSLRSTQVERDRLAELSAAADQLITVRDRAEAEDAILTHARRLTDCAIAELRAAPPGAHEVGAQVRDDVGRWLVVSQRTTPGVPFTQQDQEMLGGLAALASGALATTRVVDDLRRSDGLKSDLISAVAHDLRAPIAAANSLLRTIGERGDALDAGTQRELLAASTRATARAAQLIDDLLDLKRFEHGGRYDREPIDVGTAIAGAVAGLELGSSLTVELQGAPAVASIDAVKLARVIDNLVRNAAKYAPPASTITVAYGPADGGTAVRVIDRGPGVPPRLKERIFHPFDRGDTPEGRGIGLGLYVARRFVEFHGGRIWVEDTPGGGATFSVWLPARSGDLTSDTRLVPAAKV